MIEPRSSAGCRHVRAAGGLRLPAFIRLVLLTSGLGLLLALLVLLILFTGPL